MIKPHGEKLVDKNLSQVEKDTILKKKEICNFLF